MKINKIELRKFGVSIGVILIIISIILFWNRNEWFVIVLFIGIFFLFTGLVFISILKPIYSLWMIFANIIGWMMTRIILSLLFYIIMTPIGVIRKLTTKRINKLICNSENTYWNKKNKLKQKYYYDKQF